MKSIGIICAIPRERRPILRLFPDAVKLEQAGITCWRFRAGTNQVTLAESGMGAANAARTTAALIDAVRPSMVMSVGFCGAIKPGISVGDLVVAEQQYSLTSGTLTREEAPDLRLCRSLTQGPAGLNYHYGTFISTDAFISKSVTCTFIPDHIPTPVLEMESAAVAKVCRSAGLPVVGIRAVSDSSTEDPAQLTLKLFDPDFTLSMRRTLATLLSRPDLIPQLVRLARNTKLAGNALANSLAHALERLQ